MSDRLEAALALVAAGFRVFPVYEVVDNRCTCGRRACQSPGKHPRIKGGHLSATLAPEQIDMWWRCWPDANIGVRTGSGLLVLDIDPRNDGNRSLKALIEAHGALPETPTVSTGGGGFHFFFRVDEKVPCKSAVWPGMDVKADGGYVVVPTSVHESGRAYEWATGFSLDDLPRAHAPRWLLAELCGKKGAAPVAGSVASGARNNHLMSVAGRLRRDGSEQAAILSAIKLENQRACTPPLEGDEVGRIAASASRYSNGVASGVAQVLDASGVASLNPQSCPAERESAVARLKTAAARLDSVGRALLRDELVQRRGFSAGLADAVLRQAATAEAGQQGAAVLFKTVEPWPEPVHASAVLEVLFRSIESHGPTLLVDEADSFLRERDDLRGVLNAGHDRQSAKVLRCVGDDSEPRVFGVWAAVAFASIGKQHDTLMDRSIIVSMKRRSEASEPVSKFRRRQREQLGDLTRRLVRFATDNTSTLKDLQVEPPAGLSDRAADNWEALLAIAELAGGAWPERAKAAALALSGHDRGGEPDTHGELILRDIRDIFERTAVNDLPPKVLLKELVALEERPWPEANRGGPMTARQLGTRLGRFEIHSRTTRHGSATSRSYVRADFDDAFARYLAPLTGTSVTSMNSAAEGFGAPSPNADVTELPQGESSSQFKDVADVADVTDVTDAEAAYATEERAGIQRFGS